MRYSGGATLGEKNVCIDGFVYTCDKHVSRRDILYEGDEWGAR